MSDDLQSEITPDVPLDRALFGLRFVWLGLLVGGAVITVVLGGCVAAGLFPGANLPEELTYIFAAPVPLGLFAAYVVFPKFAQRDPRKAMESLKAQGGDVDPQWVKCTPDDPYYWFPTFAAQFFIRLGLVEGTIIMTVVFFVVAGNWVLLFVTLPAFAALILEQPTRSRYLDWVEWSRSRVQEIA